MTSSKLPTYVYVAGRGRSGTTLLNLLMANHPDVTGVGELTNLSLQCFRDENTQWEGLCGCGKRPFDCELWSQVLDGITATTGIDMVNNPFAWRMSDVGLEEEYRKRAYYTVPFVWARNKYWRVLRRLQYGDIPLISPVSRIYTPQKNWTKNRTYVVNRIAELTGTEVIVDISKDYIGMRDVYDYRQLPTKIIFITRDCRGNVWSKIRSTGHLFERSDIVDECSRDWVKVNSRILRLLSKLPREDWMHLRYEDLCHDPAGTMERVLEFVGLSYVDDILDFTDVQDHTIAGNLIRFGSKPKKIREDVAWKENLENDELETIREICAPLAEQLNYSL